MRTLHALATLESLANPDPRFYYCPTTCSRCGGAHNARCAWLGQAWVCWGCTR